MSKGQKILGKNAVIECLDSDQSINKIWLIQNSNPKLKEIEKKARAKKIPVIRVEKRELDKISDHKDHRSVIAEIAPVTLHGEDLLLGTNINKILMAVNIEDPHNLGAIARSAYAFGVDAIVIPKHKGVPVNETVISASAGAALKVPIVRVTNIVNTIEKLKKEKFWVYSTVSDPSKSENIYKIKFDKKSVILMGNEGKGLSDNILKHCDFHVSIPMEFESLNVSVATGIILSKIYADENS